MLSAWYVGGVAGWDSPVPEVLERYRCLRWRLGGEGDRRVLISSVARRNARPISPGKNVSCSFTTLMHDMCAAIY